MLLCAGFRITPRCQLDPACVALLTHLYLILLRTGSHYILDPVKVLQARRGHCNWKMFAFTSWHGEVRLASSPGAGTEVTWSDCPPGLQAGNWLTPALSQVQAGIVLCRALPAEQGAAERLSMGAGLLRKVWEPGLRACGSSEGPLSGSSD